VLATFKGAALGGLLTLVVVGGQHATAPSAQPGGTAEADAYARVVERAVADHRCSFAGFGDRAVPASALIRTAAGEVRQVSFEVGWDVYNGKRPGTLIAVCLDDNDPGELVRVHGRLRPVPPLA
jgi:hypothetical protein